MNLFNLLVESKIKEHKRNYINTLKKYLSKEDLNKVKSLLPSLKPYSTRKKVHSLNVSKEIIPFNDVDTIVGALFHDFIELGGDVNELPISDTAKDIIKFLTVYEEEYQDSENIPLSHMEDVFSQINSQLLKNKLIRIKLYDRLDNLKNRGGSATKKYLKKSLDLMKLLGTHYSGQLDFTSIINTIQEKLDRKIHKSIK